MLSAAGRGALTGLVLGAFILGIGGRVLMRGLALATGRPAGFSMGGSLEVVASGALYGVLGGLLVLLLPARLGGWQIPVHAAGMLVLYALTSDAARGAVASVPWPARGLALAACAALVFVFSWRLVAWRLPVRATAPRP